MSTDDLIPVLAVKMAEDEFYHAVFTDALHQFPHNFVLHGLEGVVRKSFNLSGERFPGIQAVKRSSNSLMLMRPALLSLGIFNHLLCQICVCLGNLALGIVREYRFSFGTAPDGTDTHGDFAVENLYVSAVGSANQIHNILSKAWTFVHHGNEYAPDLETGFILRLTFE